MKGYDASSRKSLNELVTDITNLPVTAYPVLAFYILDDDLMIPTDSFRWAWKIVKFFRGRQGQITFFLNLHNRDPRILSEFLNQTIDHILYGNDTEDHDSIGGWSQAEVDKMTIIMDILQIAVEKVALKKV